MARGTSALAALTAALLVAVGLGTAQADTVVRKCEVSTGSCTDVATAPSSQSLGPGAKACEATPIIDKVVPVGDGSESACRSRNPVPGTTWSVLDAHAAGHDVGHDSASRSSCSCSEDSLRIDETIVGVSAGPTAP